MSAEALAQERRLIAAARTLMDTDPRRALDRLTEHEHRFATGMLAPERLRLSIRAWCRLDRPERARRLAATTDDTTAILARECPDTDAGPTGDSPSTGP